jgi:predicted DNA binding CopG/RHH family protein
MSNSKPPLPGFRSDKEAEDFVDNADLTQFDLTGGEPVRYEFKSKDANVSMRMPRQLLDAVKARAQREGIPYQRFIRQTLEHAVGGRSGKVE